MKRLLVVVLAAAFVLGAVFIGTKSQAFRFPWAKGSDVGVAKFGTDIAVPNLLLVRKYDVFAKAFDFFSDRFTDFEGDFFFIKFDSDTGKFWYDGASWWFEGVKYDEGDFGDKVQFKFRSYDDFMKFFNFFYYDGGKWYAWAFIDKEGFWKGPFFVAPEFFDFFKFKESD